MMRIVVLSQPGALGTAWSHCAAVRLSRRLGVPCITASDSSPDPENEHGWVATAAVGALFSALFHLADTAVWLHYSPRAVARAWARGLRCEPRSARPRFQDNRHAWRTSVTVSCTWLGRRMCIDCYATRPWRICRSSTCAAPAKRTSGCVSRNTGCRRVRCRWQERPDRAARGATENTRPLVRRTSPGCKHRRRSLRRKKGQHLRREQLGGLLGDVVPAGRRSPTDPT